MPGLHTRHPDSDKLAAFGLGRLSDADSKEIEQHLDDCDECRKKLEDIPPDSLVCLLQGAADTQAGAAGPSSDTDSSFLSKESVPPLYKKLAQIIAGDPSEQPIPKDSPAGTAKASFAMPKELDGHARYEILEPLGAGGMGTVYKAQHRLMERVVALKIVNPLLVNRPGAAERFEREVKAAAKLVHPNIVTAFDAEKVGDMHILVMEFVEGQTLAQVLAERRELPVAQACGYIVKTALGLQHALERGMVHRDIKPQNLMLTSRGEIKILDFGLARFVSEQAQSYGSTEHGALMGSPDYMAPEQGHDAHSADARADIYSMGCTLYQLLAGEVPFPETSLLSKLEAHRDKQPIPLNHVRPDVPVALAKVIEKMMAKDPAKRYQTPAEVAEALRPFTQVTDIAAAPLRPEGRRSRLPVFAGALVALFVVVGIGYWLAQIIFRVETPHGTLIVKTDDPNVEIAVKSAGKEVDLIFTKQKKTIPLKIGDYSLEVVKGIEGMKLSMNSFKITNDQKSVTVEFVPIIAEKKAPKVEKNAKASEAAIPSVAELLKTREVLTVAQDGKAMYATLTAALEKIKSGQVVHVLDKGPYRESLIREVPENIALVSQVGTRIEVSKWHRWGPEPSNKDKSIYQGLTLWSPRGIRLSGLEIICPELPADASHSVAVEFPTGGEVVVESCRIVQTPSYERDKTPQDWNGEVFNSLRLGRNDGDAGGRQIVRDCHLEGTVDFGRGNATEVVMERNRVLAHRLGMGVGFGATRAGKTVIRHNVIHAFNGIYVGPQDAKEEARASYLIANNVLDVTNSAFWASDFDKIVIPKAVRIHNNIIHSRHKNGIEVTTPAFPKVKDVWQVSHNCYRFNPNEHVKQPDYLLLAPGATDPIRATQFLSDDRAAVTNYLRIAADSPLATAGVGGDLPKYMGAFPPGPAPKDGDWFTKLLEVAKREVPLAKSVAPTVKDLLAKARAASEEKKFDEAVRHCHEALRLEPNHIEAIYLRAWPQWNLGKSNLAIDDVTAVLKVNPDHHDARHNRSFYYLHTNRLDECIADANEFQTRHKSSAVLHYRGHAWFLKGRFDKALADFEAYLKFNPTDAGAHSWQGTILARLGDPAKAKIAHATALKLDKSIKTHGTEPLDLTVVPQPMPLAEWLEGRIVLTVAQDGKAMFKTIGAAIDALKTGQVIKILDKGPYRERLDRDLPENVGIISDVGTRIEWTEWRKLDPRPEEPKKFNFVGMVLHCPRHLRLAGLEIAAGTADVNAGFTSVIAVTADGDVVVESCRMMMAGGAAGRFNFASWGKHNGNLWLRDNEFNRHVFPHAAGSSVVVERNLLRDQTHEVIHLFSRTPPREFVFRHNITQGVNGIQFGALPNEAFPAEWADTPVLISNNYIECEQYPIWFQPGDDPTKRVYPGNVRIHNNIMHSKEQRGVILLANGLTKVKDMWQVSHNCYPNEPGGLGGLAAFPRHANDLIEARPFLSHDPKSGDYLRISAKSPFATAGIGGNLPSYIGPLPPGPPTKAGDWFSRLRSTK